MTNDLGGAGGGQLLAHDHMVSVRRLALAVSCGAVALLAGTVAAVSVVAGPWLPWVLGVALAVAVVAVVASGLHAGGHGFFIPLPVLALAVAWALSASAGSWSSPLAWLLAALTLAGAALGVLLVAPAVLHHGQGNPAVGTEALVGASGTAMTELAPAGIARVNNETWTVESLSGPLPAGAPVHVARVSGLRLMVWSEVGTVPTAGTLGPITNKEET